MISRLRIALTLGVIITGLLSCKKKYPETIEVRFEVATTSKYFSVKCSDGVGGIAELHSPFAFTKAGWYWQISSQDGDTVFLIATNEDTTSEQMVASIYVNNVLKYTDTCKTKSCTVAVDGIVAH